MGRVLVHEFVTADGVADAPVWSAPHGFPPEQAAAVAAITSTCTGLLLGRTTYELFAPAWSARSEQDDPGAPFFNGTRKHVVSSTLVDPAWGPVTVHPYDPEGLRALKAAEGGDLYVSGSATLVRALLADGLVDELHLFTYPLVLGTGPRLFAEGGPRTALRLAASRAFDNGVVQLVYEPTAG